MNERGLSLLGWCVCEMWGSWGCSSGHVPASQAEKRPALKERRVGTGRGCMAVAHFVTIQGLNSAVTWESNRRLNRDSREGHISWGEGSGLVWCTWQEKDEASARHSPSPNNNAHKYQVSTQQLDEPNIKFTTFLLQFRNFAKLTRSFVP